MGEPAPADKHADISLAQAYSLACGGSRGWGKLLDRIVLYIRIIVACFWDPRPYTHAASTPKVSSELLPKGHLERLALGGRWLGRKSV